MPYTIQQIKTKITPILSTYGIKKAYLFGSYAKGYQSENSDIDLLIEKGALKSLFQLGGLQEELSETLKKRVDLITTDSLDYRAEESQNKSFKEVLKDEEILLYDDGLSNN